MAEVAPIRPDVTPEMDVEREMISFVAEKLREYVIEHGSPPFSLAFVLVGHDQVGAQTDAFSWSPANESSSTLFTCSVASAVLLKRALGV